MTMNNYGGGPIEQRKAEVRKHANRAKIAAGVGGVSLVAGILLKSTILWLIIPIIAVAAVGYNVWKIREVVNHKDQW